MIDAGLFFIRGTLRGIFNFVGKDNIQRHFPLLFLLTLKYKLGLMCELIISYSHYYFNASLGFNLFYNNNKLIFKQKFK